MKRKKIKILFLIDKIWPGGSENQLILLAENLPRDKFTPFIGVLEKSELQESMILKTPLIEIDMTLKCPFKAVNRIWQIARFLRREKIDILHTFFPTSTILGALAVQLLPKEPLFISVRRNLYHWIEEERLNFKFLRLTGKWTDMVLTNSHAVLQRAKQLEGLPSRKLRIIPNGIETEKFRKMTREQARKHLNLNGAEPVIGVVGNWRPVKGLKYFLEAAGRVAGQFPGAQFILVGFGPQKKELIEQANRLGIRAQTIFIEGSRRVEQIIPAFDIAVQSSLSESFSNVLLEYMACGKAVVATRVGDAGRVIEANRGGILVDAGDIQQLGQGILFLLENNLIRKKMGDYNRKKVRENWLVDNMISGYETLYSSLANGNLNG
jgi:glycosyltransferase involved in cell wall biosynthesis